MNAHAPGEPPIQCKQDASIAGGIGVALILAGIIGFIATISTGEDDDKPKPIEIKAQPDQPPIVVPNANPPPTPAPAPAPTPAPAT